MMAPQVDVPLLGAIAKYNLVDAIARNNTFNPYQRQVVEVFFYSILFFWSVWGM